MKSVQKVVNFEEFSNETKEMKRDDFMNFDNPKLHGSLWDR